MPSSIEVSAPGCEAAFRAVFPSTTLVDEPLGSSGVAVASAVAWSGGRGVGVPPPPPPPPAARVAGTAKASAAARLARSSARGAARRMDIVDLLFVGGCEGGQRSVVRSDNQDGSFRHARTDEPGTE